MKKLVFILLIACFSCSLVLKHGLYVLDKHVEKAVSKDQKDAPKKAFFDEARTDVSTFTINFSVKEVFFVNFYQTFYVAFKTYSDHLNYQTLFKSKYFHTILRFFVAPQAP